MRVGTVAGGNIPNMVYMDVPGRDSDDCRNMSLAAVRYAQNDAPKLSGESAANLLPLWGNGYFGIMWQHSYVWFQEVGIRPFTMRALAGRTIPMWIDDPTGRERQRNPRARTRVTAAGKTQVLIFRRAALPGQTKQVRRNGRMVTVPRSYPGAPGRIAQREAARPFTTIGRVGGRIARGNVGVRWRHPGLTGRDFLDRSMVRAAHERGSTTNLVNLARL